MGPRLLLPVVSPQMEQLCLYSQQWEEAEGVGVGGSMAASPEDHHQEVVSVTSAHGELQGSGLCQGGQGPRHKRGVL